MSESLAASGAEIIRRGRVQAADVGRLREALAESGSVAVEDVRLLFAIHEACSADDPGWSDFFVHAVARFIVRDRPPSGYLTQDKADWLTARLADANGVIATRVELEILVAALERARWRPASLVRFALRQVEHAVRGGAGPLRACSARAPGEISASEIALVRRILCANGGDEATALTREEAQVLFSIDESLSDSFRNPAWTELFVKAIAHALMAGSGHAAPPRREALRGDSWMNLLHEIWPHAFPAAAVASNVDLPTDKYRRQSAEERSLARLDRQRIELITDETMTVADARWLAQRLGRAGPLTAAETALIGSLRRAKPHLHPVIEDVLERRPLAA